MTIKPVLVPKSSINEVLWAHPNYSASKVGPSLCHLSWLKDELDARTIDEALKELDK